jgi:hypothetical protein
MEARHRRAFFVSAAIRRYSWWMSEATVHRSPTAAHRPFRVWLMIGLGVLVLGSIAAVSQRETLQVRHHIRGLDTDDPATFERHFAWLVRNWPISTEELIDHGIPDFTLGADVEVSIDGGNLSSTRMFRQGDKSDDVLNHLLDTIWIEVSNAFHAHPEIRIPNPRATPDSDPDWDAWWKALPDEVTGSGP